MGDVAATVRHEVMTLGWLSNLVSKVTGNASAASAVGDLIKGGGGTGLSQLVDHLKAGGLAGEVDSWVSTGVNKAVTSDQVQRAMGSKLGQVAARMGVTPEAAATQLTSVLPGLIDRLTPDGQIPSGAALTQQLKHATRKAPP